MRKLLTAVFVALLMAGCGGSDLGSDSPEPPAKTTQVAKIDLDDKETLDKIIVGAIDYGKVEWRDEQGKKLYYIPNQPSPYSGWIKSMHHNGKLWWLDQYKDGELNGLQTVWYHNGQKKRKQTMKEGKLISAVAWKPNGEKCPMTKVVEGNGVVVRYNDDETELSRQTFKDGYHIPD